MLRLPPSSAAIAFFLILFGLLLPATSHAAKLTAGPMLGYSEMREVALWVQTDESADVRIAYWPAGKPANRKITPPVQTRAEEHFTATFHATDVRPGTTYEYAVLIDGDTYETPYKTQFQTLPDYLDRLPPPDFTIAAGSGHYVNQEAYDPPFRTPGGGYSIFLAILAKKPDAMFWLGDTATLRPADWGSRAGYLARYATARALPELQPLLASVHHYATWGARDFGPPDTGRYLWNRETARDAFSLYWPNPSHGVNNLKGITTYARWSDVDFFLLDDRWWRSHNDGRDQFATMGESQLEWLGRALKQSRATFKVIIAGSSILKTDDDNPANWAAAPRERDRFLDYLRREKIDGVFFLTGGHPYTELTRAVRASAPPVYELSLGPLTARPAEDTDEVNYFRVPATSVFERNFATLRFHGDEEDRKLTITVYDVDGIEKWSQTLNARDMLFK